MQSLGYNHAIEDLFREKSKSSSSEKALGVLVRCSSPIPSFMVFLMINRFHIHSPAFFTLSTRAISADGSLWMRTRCLCTRKESTCRRAWRITCGRTRFTHVTCAKKRSTTSSTLRSITGSFTSDRRNQWRWWKILGRWIAQPSDR